MENRTLHLAMKTFSWNDLRRTKCMVYSLVYTLEMKSMEQWVVHRISNKSVNPVAKISIF